MSSLVRRQQSASSLATKLMPVGSLSGLAGLAAFETHFFLAGLFSVGALYVGRKLFDTKRNRRNELSRRARENVRALRGLAWEDRTAAPQMKRLISLQQGLMESWELLPAEYRPMLDDDVFTVVGEVEASALLARRRSALRKYLESVDRREISRRIKSLQKDLEALEAGSPLATSFENALQGRQEELDRYDDILGGISAINAQLEGMESLLGNLRGELLALDTRVPPHSLEPDLARLKTRVGFFRSSLEEVTQAVGTVPEAPTSRVKTG